MAITRISFLALSAAILAASPARANDLPPEADYDFTVPAITVVVHDDTNHPISGVKAMLNVATQEKNWHVSTATPIPVPYQSWDDLSLDKVDQTTDAEGTTTFSGGHYSYQNGFFKKSRRGSFVSVWIAQPSFQADGYNDKACQEEQHWFVTYSYEPHTNLWFQDAAIEKMPTRFTFTISGQAKKSTGWEHVSLREGLDAWKKRCDELKKP